MRVPDWGGVIHDAWRHEDAGLQVPTMGWSGAVLSHTASTAAGTSNRRVCCSRAAVRAATLYHRAGDYATQATRRPATVEIALIPLISWDYRDVFVFYSIGELLLRAESCKLDQPGRSYSDFQVCHVLQSYRVSVQAISRHMGRLVSRCKKHHPKASQRAPVCAMAAKSRLAFPSARASLNHTENPRAHSAGHDVTGRRWPPRVGPCSCGDAGCYWGVHGLGARTRCWSTVVILVLLGPRG